MFLVARFGQELERLTGKKQIGFWFAVVFSFLTLGIFSVVYQVALAFHLQRFSVQGSGIPNRRLGLSVLGLLVLSFVVGFASGGAGILFAVLIYAWSLWLIAAELNNYRDTG